MAKSKLPRFSLRSPRGEWVLVHHRSEALDEIDVSILGLTAPMAFEVRAATMCGTTPSDAEILKLVQCATQTPNHGDPGIPARIVVASDEWVARLRVALPGVAIQARAGAAEESLMPMLLEAFDEISDLLDDESELLSDSEQDLLCAVEAILEEETADFVAALEEEDDDLVNGAAFDGLPLDSDRRTMNPRPDAVPEAHSKIHASLLDAAMSAVETVLRVARSKAEARMEEAAKSSLNVQHAGVYVALATEHAGTNAVGLQRRNSNSRESAATKSALAMLADARTSYFRVLATDPEKGILTLEDVFAGDTVDVRDYGAAKGLEPSLILFAVLVPHDDVFLCVAAHPQPLHASEGEIAIARARKTVGRRGVIAAERLREPATLRALLESWDEHVHAAENRDGLPTLVNHDGDPVLLTTDHFAFADVDRAAIVDALSSGPDADRDKEGLDDVIRWTRAPAEQRGLETVLWACVRIGPTSLRVETNSARRADDARARVERLAGKPLRHRLREHTDPTSSEVLSARPKPASSSIDAETEIRMLLAFKAQHYATWPDIPVPALDGKTPRAAAKSAKLRPRLSKLLEEMAAGEARMPAAQRFDFSALRKDLGM